MTKHVEIKHKIKSINNKTTFEDILENSMLSDTEKKMMRMYYVDNKSITFIADELGYSSQGILKMHKRILKRLEALL